MSYYEYEPYSYVGSTDRALLYSSVSLINVLYISDNVYDLADFEEMDPEYIYDYEQWKNTLTSIIALVEHILPDVISCHHWLNIVSERLIAHYAQNEPNQFKNLFGQDLDRIVLGDYVPREILDLDIGFNKKNTVAQLTQYLSIVNRHNPLLIPLEELNKYFPTPYHIND